MKLSIIIPIYNAEKYLSKCLDEVSSCPFEEMECILINDGSTDSSLSICESYARIDTRFKVISKSNEGVSVARNCGLSRASGKYVLFLDADDYVDSTKWSIIFESTCSDHDFISFSYYTLYENGNIKEQLFNIGAADTSDIYYVRKLLLGSPDFNTCWGKLIKLEIIKEGALSFRGNLKTCEDAIFILEFIQKANKFLLKNESILYYRQHPESVMHKLDIHSKIKDFKELFECRKKLSILWDDIELKGEMYREFFSVITDLLLRYAQQSNVMECKRVFKTTIEQDIVKDILLNVNSNNLKTIYKKIELYILKYRYIPLITSYFKLKKLLL